MNRTMLRVLAAVRSATSLHDDADEEGTIATIKANVDFRGINLWALVLAIIVASVGLNVNSTAVIIGAMLISPLMGPIMGAGLALGINDVALLRRSVRNLGIAALVSVLTSMLYFAVSPLADAQSELLARTRPTIYDVLIALAGGAAGIVAATRRSERSNVIPGVAIATALMPPLCTAGFGISRGDWMFTLGALYLFVINSVFICLATLGVVRLLHFQRVVDLDVAHARRIRALIGSGTLVTVVPSVVVAWGVVQQTRFESAARRYVAENFVYAERSVVNTSLRYRRDSSTIETTLLGRPLSPDAIEALHARLPAYGIPRTRLILHQTSDGSINPEQLGQVVRAGILEDLYKRNQEALETRDTRIRMLEDEIVRMRGLDGPVRDATLELSALYPSLESLMIGAPVRVGQPSAARDSSRVVIATWRRLPTRTERERIRRFLQVRLRVDSLDIRDLPATQR